MLIPDFLHYLAAGIAISLGAIGTGIGQGIAACSAIGAMGRQKMGNSQIFRAMVIGLAFIESGVILALVMTILMLFGGITKITLPMAIAEMGIAIAMGIAASAISIASCFAVKSACVSMARQPFWAQKILTLMLLAQSIIEAPVVFTFVISLLIRANINETMTIFEGVKYFSVGLCMALGCIGPSIGQAIFANSSCKAAGLNRSAYNKIFTFSIINEAVIETPLIFCLLISILIFYMPISFLKPFFSAITFLMAAITVGFGSIGTAVGAGFVASKSCYQIALEPKNYSVLFRSTLLAEAFIESAMIYALIIALALVTKS